MEDHKLQKTGFQHCWGVTKSRANSGLYHSERKAAQKGGYIHIGGLPWWLSARMCLQCRGPESRPLSQEDPLEKGMATTPVLLPGESTWTEAWQAAALRIAEWDTTEATAAAAYVYLWLIHFVVQYEANTTLQSNYTPTNVSLKKKKKRNSLPNISTSKTSVQTVNSILSMLKMVLFGC